MVLGPSLLTVERTNAGGWWNIPKNAQLNGNYFIIALKGFRLAVQSATYEGEALQLTGTLK